MNRSSAAVVAVVLAFAPAVSGAARPIVALGDSLTVGYPAAVPYTVTLAEVLGPGWTVVNAGRNGDLAAHLWVRFMAAILPAPPEAIIVLGGVNDVALDVPSWITAANLTAIYRVSHELGITVVAVTVLPFGGCLEEGCWTPQRQIALDVLNAWIRTAPDVDVVVEAYGALGDRVAPQHLRPAFDSGDGLHLNAAGYRALGRLIAATAWHRSLAETE